MPRYRGSVTQRLVGGDNVIPVHRFYIEMFGGDVWTAMLLAQLLYWQDGRTRHPEGWVVKTYEDWYNEIYITEKRLDNARVLLEAVGLDTKTYKSQFHNNERALHWRIDLDIFEVVQVNFAKDLEELIAENKQKGLTGNNQKYPQSFCKSAESTVLYLQSLCTEITKRDGNLVPNGTSLEKSSNSKKKATPNTPPNQTGANLPPTPRPDNLHDSSHGYTPYQLIGREIRRKFFNIADDITPDEKTLGKSQRLAGWLFNDSPRPNGESMDEKVKSLLTEIGGFVKWYSKKMNGAILPHSPESLSSHWLAYLSTKPAHTPTASYTMETWGGAKTDTTNSPANGGGGDTMMLDNNIFGFLFGKRKDE